MIQYSMRAYSMRGGKIFLWASLFVFSFSMQAAAVEPLSGLYCPNENARSSIAGDIVASLDLSMRSRTAQINKDSTQAISELASVKTTLFLAGSHGAAARTVMILDAIIQAKAGEGYARMLSTWLPLLHASQRALPNDATVKAAADLIDRAEDFMRGASEGDPMNLLAQARHLLSCDSLDIPLQKSIQAQNNLIKDFANNPEGKDYDALLNALRDTLHYALERNDGLQ